ncbi:MAG: hypothetical protein HKN22_03145, partial [Bacteroidia bacterium]|nr:hypothetical protein [Bacteroidia bacterium]
IEIQCDDLGGDYDNSTGGVTARATWTYSSPSPYYSGISGSCAPSDPLDNIVEHSPAQLEYISIGSADVYRTMVILNGTFFDMGKFQPGNPDLPASVHDLDGIYDAACAPFTSTFAPMEYCGGDVLNLNGAEVNVYKNVSCGLADVTANFLFYRVYKDGTTPPAFSTASIPFFDNCPAGYPGSNAFSGGGTCQNQGCALDQRWQASPTTGFTPINLIPSAPVSASEAGTYKVEFYTTTHIRKCGGDTDILEEPADATSANNYYTTSFELSESELCSCPCLDLSASVTDENCAGGGLDGVINLSVSGGSGTYNYLWSDGSTSEDISSLSAGSYSVTVTDAANSLCDAEMSFVVGSDKEVAEFQKLLPSGADAVDLLGFSNDIDGDVAVLGGFFNNSVVGEAYAYVFDGSAWTESQQLTPSDGNNDDRFGIAVSVSGKRIAVGANLGDRDATVNTGAVYIFDFDGSSWSQTAKITASDFVTGDRFGRSVDLEGDRLIVGADLADGTGSAYIYDFNGLNWIETAIINGQNAFDRFGYSVALSGNTAAIGAVNYSNSGGVFIYDFIGSSWNLTTTLTASDAAVGDEFGVDLDLLGDRLVVAAEGDESNQGAGYVFDRIAGSWSETTKLTASDGVAGDRLSAVALGNDKIYAGAFAINSETGTVYRYDYNGSSWSETQKLLASDGLVDDRFGRSVAVSGGRLAVGAPRLDDNVSQGGGMYFFHPEKCKCDPGFFVEGFECVECQPGYFCSDGIDSLPCQPGFFSSLPGQQFCNPCAVGEYSSKKASTFCTPCPENTASSFTAAANCQPCSPGSYAPFQGQAVCSVCPAPSISCPADITVSAPAGLCNASVIVPTPTFTDLCVSNQGLDFDGVDDYVSAADNASLDLTGNVTFEAWVFVKGPNALNSAQSIIDKTETGDLANYRPYLFNNNMNFWNGSTIAGAGTNPVPTGTWSHVAWVLESGTMTYYLNGSPNGSVSTSLGAVNNGQLFIGRDNFGAGNGRYANMIIDEVRIWNDARTNSEITT